MLMLPRGEVDSADDERLQQTRVAVQSRMAAVNLYIYRRNEQPRSSQWTEERVILAIVRQRICDNARDDLRGLLLCCQSRLPSW